jgi:hypothetical protein
MMQKNIFYKALIFIFMPLQVYTGLAKLLITGNSHDSQRKINLLNAQEIMLHNLPITGLINQNCHGLGAFSALSITINILSVLSLSLIASEYIYLRVKQMHGL